MNYLVVLDPPMSGVLTLLSSSVIVMALTIRSANMGSPMYLSIITELNKIEVGFAMFFPASFIPE